MTDFDAEALDVLLQANSKDTVIRLCNEAFLYRDLKRIPDSVISSVTQALSVSVSQAHVLVAALSGIIKTCLFQSLQEPADIATLFPDDFHRDLLKLLCRIISENVNSWKAHAINNQLSLPRLVDFDWRIDLKASSQNISRMSVPTCILQLQVQETSREVGEIAPLTCTNVELSKETLDTMLEGLGKIRDQLSSVSQK